MSIENLMFIYDRINSRCESAIASRYKGTLGIMVGKDDYAISYQNMQKCRKLVRRWIVNKFNNEASWFGK